MRASIVIGNPNAGGRTTRVAQMLTENLVGALNWSQHGGEDIETIELANYAKRLFEWEDQELSELNEKVASSDVVIVASPVYKASYTGLLKAFLDRYQTNGLLGTVSIPIMVGASPAHTLSIESHLRPLLVELGSSVPTRGLYVLESEIDNVQIQIEKFIEENGSVLRKSIS